MTRQEHVGPVGPVGSVGSVGGRLAASEYGSESKRKAGQLVEIAERLTVGQSCSGWSHLIPSHQECK